MVDVPENPTKPTNEPPNLSIYFPPCWLGLYHIPVTPLKKGKHPLFTKRSW